MRNSLIHFMNWQSSTDNRERNLRESGQKSRRPGRAAREAKAVFTGETGKKIPTDKSWDYKYWW